MVLRDAEWYIQKKRKLDHQLTPYTRINSRWKKDLNISCDDIKVLDENIGSKISDIPHSNIFDKIPHRERKIKERINKWDLIELKSFFMAKKKIRKMKREPTIWDNILANDTLDKGLISKIYKELIHLNTRKTNNLIKKWAHILNRHFSKEDIQRDQRHMKGCSTSLATKEMQIKVCIFNV